LYVSRAAISGISVLVVLLALLCCTCYSVVFLKKFWANKLMMMMTMITTLTWQQPVRFSVQLAVLLQGLLPL